MDEDTERLKAMSHEFAKKIIDAYRLRFPTPTPDSKNITFNSLIIAMLSFLETLEDVERANAIDILIGAYQEYMEMNE